MNPQKTANSPLVKSIVLSALKTPIKTSEKGHLVNSELVPRISKRLINKKFLSEKRIGPVSQQGFPALPITRQATTADVLTRPEGYGKLQPLLVDPTVTSIECLGADKNLTIVRAGQVLQTKISLSQKEIIETLKNISEKVHIPLIEGVFRAAVDNFVINAVFSKIISSRFVIRKQTPYSLLESRSL